MRASAGEGFISGGQSAESIRLESGGETTAQQDALAMTSGAMTGLISMVSGKVAGKLGIADPDIIAAGGDVVEAAVRKGLHRRMVEGFIVEGFMEELPQSVQEAVIQNVATGKDPFDNIDQEAVMGTLAGGVVGAGFNALSGSRGPKDDGDIDMMNNDGVVIPPAQPYMGEVIPGAQNDLVRAGLQGGQYGEVIPTPQTDMDMTGNAVSVENFTGEQRATTLEEYQAKYEQEYGTGPEINTELDAMAHEAATSPLNDKPIPTQEEAEKGKYEKGKLKLHGLSIDIENPKGSERSGVDPDGTPWSVTMPGHYGEIKRTKGADGDAVDVYIGDQQDSETIFVVDQHDANTGEFDEHKVIMGVDGPDAANQLYTSGFSDGLGDQRFGGMAQMTVDQFKEWLKDGDQNVPVAVQNYENAQEFDVNEQDTNSVVDQKTENVSDNGPDPDHIPDAGENIELEPERQEFINNKVQELGSVEDVYEFYTDDSPVSQYAKQRAREVFGVANVSPENETSKESLQVEGVAAGESKPDQEKYNNLPSAVKEQIDNDAPLNDKVSELVYALNGAGIETSLSGDAYGDDYIYVDVKTPIDEAQLPDGWVLTWADIPLAERDILGTPPTNLTEEDIESRESEPKRRIARVGKEKITEKQALDIVNAITGSKQSKQDQEFKDDAAERIQEDDKDFPFSPDDIDKKKAEAAYAGTSTTPSKAAELEQQQYIRFLKDLREDMQKDMPEGKEPILADYLERTAKEYVLRRNKVFSVRENTVSSHVAGRSNFNSKQAQRRNNALDKAENDFSDWMNSAREFLAIKTGVSEVRKRQALKAKQAKAEARKEADRREKEQRTADVKLPIINDPNIGEAITREQWSKTSKDYKSIVVDRERGYRYRSMMVFKNGASSLMPVFISDMKVKEAPAQVNETDNTITDENNNGRTFDEKMQMAYPVGEGISDLQDYASRLKVEASVPGKYRNAMLDAATAGDNGKLVDAIRRVEHEDRLTKGVVPAAGYFSNNQVQSVMSLIRNDKSTQANQYRAMATKYVERVGELDALDKKRFDVDHLELLLKHDEVLAKNVNDRPWLRVVLDDLAATKRELRDHKERHTANRRKIYESTLSEDATFNDAEFKSWTQANLASFKGMGNGDYLLPSQEEEFTEHTKRSSQKTTEDKESAVDWKKATFQQYLDGIRSMNSGDMDYTEYQSMVGGFIERADAVRAEIGGMTKKAITGEMGWMFEARYKNEKKDTVVSAAFDNLLSNLNATSSGMSFSMAEINDPGAYARKIIQAIKETTEESYNAWRDKQAQDTKEHREKVEAYRESLKNPKTVADFQALMRGRDESSLTEEQRVTYDRLVAEQSLEASRKKIEERATVESVDTDVPMEIVEHYHTKRGQNVFIVTMANRVEREEYDALNKRAKQLGGRYSRSFKGSPAGFQFYDQETAEKFVGMEQESNVDKVMERKEEKKLDAADRLIEIAERLEESGSESLNADRKDNTARRARMAASAEASAQADIAMAKTIRNLAEAIKSGEAKFLGGVRAKTHVEELSSILNQAKYEAIRSKDDSYRYFEKERHRKATEEDIFFAKYPYPSFHRENLQSDLMKIANLDGLKKISTDLLKAVRKGTGDGHMLVVRNSEKIADLRKIANDNRVDKWLRERVADELKKYDRMQRMGIPNVQTLRTALREFLQYREKAKGPDRLKQLRREMIGKKDNDFFPTPPALVERVIEEAGIEQGMSVLEPSAGFGDIAVAAREAGGNVEVVEMSGQLRDYLGEVGFTPTSRDFMEHSGEYDRIVMNPPFSKRQDVDHVRHAFGLLKPGGRLAAITSDGPFFGSDTKAQEFRDFVDQYGWSEKLPEGSFKDSHNTTGVATRLVVLEKPATDTSFRLSGPAATDSNTLGVARARRVARRIAQKIGNVDIAVVGSFDELPAAIKKDIGDNYNERNQPKGATHKNSVFVVANAHNTVAELEETIVHELVGHLGVRRLFGNSIADRMVKLYSDIGEYDGFEKLAKGRGKFGYLIDYANMIDNQDLNEEQQLRIIMEELLAVYAETPKFMDRIKSLVGAVRQWLRDHTFLKLSEYGDTDLLHILSQSKLTLNEDGNAFNRWFNGSKIVNEDGTPRVVYHGTNADFSEFKTSERGIFFSESPTVASNYTEYKRSADSVNDGNVMPVYLSMQNPVTVEFGSGKSLAAAVEEAKENGNDGVIVKGYPDTYRGNDVVADMYIVFEPSQIKSATGNQGTYDGSIDDVRYRLPRPKGGVGPAPSVLKDASPRVKDAVDYLRMKFQDKFIPLLNVQKMLQERGWVMNDSNDAYRAEELFHGKAENRLEKFYKGTIEPLLEQIKSSSVSMEELEEYLYAKFAPERNAYIASINESMPDGGSGMTNAEARQIITQFSLAGKAQELERLAREVRKITQLQRDIISNEGLELDETMDAWELNNNNYVPLKGGHDDKGRGIGTGYNVKRSGTKQALGRRSRATNILAHLFDQAGATIVRAEKVKVSRAFLNMVEENPDSDLWTVYDPKKKATMPAKRKLGDNPEVKRITRKLAKRTYLLNNGHLTEKGKAKVQNEIAELREQLDGLNERIVKNVIDPSLLTGDNVLTVTREDGSVVYVEIGDTELARVMKKLKPHQYGPITRALGTITRYLSRMSTSFNPEFVVTNFERDIQTAMAHLGTEQSTKLAGRVLKGIPGAMRGIRNNLRNGDQTSEWGQWFERYKQAGAQVSFMDLRGVEDWQRRFHNLGADGALDGANETIRKIGQFFNDYNEAVENAVRLSAFRNAIDGGMSESDAASLAKNLTVNFNRKGELGPAMNALYMFANAGVQGSARIVQALTNKKSRKRMTKLMGAVTLMAFGLAELNRLSAGDDDDDENRWDKVNDYTKQVNLVFTTEDGEWKIRTPYGYNAFVALGYAMNDVFHYSIGDGGSSPVDAGRFMVSTMMNAFNPLGGDEGLIKILSPTITDPLIEIATNENFMGDNIMPDNFKFGPQKPNSELYFRTVSQPSKSVAQWLNSVTGGSSWEPGMIDISPEVLDHMASFIFGGVGRTFGRMADLPAKISNGDLQVRNVPFARQVYQEKVPYVYFDRFYDNINTIAASHAAVREMPVSERVKFISGHPELRLRKMSGRYQRQLSSMRERYYQLKDSGNHEEARRVQERMQRHVIRFNKAYNGIMD